MADFDVLIAGAGPAGCATALSLGRFAPGLRVGFAGPPPGPQPRIGEVVPPLIRPILEHLGLWHRFSGERHVRVYRTVSSWGGPGLGSNEFLEFPYNVGWHLDRARFDGLLEREARAGVDLRIDAGVEGVRHEDGRWWLDCGGDAGSHSARVVVDATGRAAVLCRTQGVRPRRLDRLVASYRFFEAGESDGDGLLVEACAEGWWYTAQLPGNRRVAVCMTDADILRRLGLREQDAWMGLLAGTRFLRDRLAGKRPVTPLSLRPAGSQLVESGQPSTLLAVGDAASCFDPVSSQGITKALRSGVFASYAIADWLCRGDARGLERYRAFTAREFGAYLKALRKHYALEPRWPDSPFWRRRRAGLASGREAA